MYEKGRQFSCHRITLPDKSPLLTFTLMEGKTQKIKANIELLVDSFLRWFSVTRFDYNGA